jgi:IS5 family transposase
MRPLKTPVSGPADPDEQEERRMGHVLRKMLLKWGLLRKGAQGQLEEALPTQEPLLDLTPRAPWLPPLEDDDFAPSPFRRDRSESEPVAEQDEIRGKAGQQVEFGHMVEVRQIEGGLITHYAAHAKRPAEAPLLERAVVEHKELFGRVPEVCAGDKGFYSQQAVENVVRLGVKRVCVPKKGRRNEEEEKKEHSRWFKLAQAFRAGIEGTISVLKRVFGLWRCLREGWVHFQSWVGTGVLAHNLVLLART